MKQCTYCGGEYPDDAVICPVDQNALVVEVASSASYQKKRSLVLSVKHLNGIGPVGRWLIFAGIPTAILAILLVSTMHHGLDKSLVSAVGEKALPYVLFFTPVVIGIIGRVLYEYFPKRLVIPFGVTGWVFGLSLLYWYFWFGPGAFGHH